jgi:MFS family permease
LRTFLVFLAAYVLSQFFRSFFAVIASDLADRLSLSAQDLGNISATWFWSFAFAQFAVGWALDRFGPRVTMPVFMLAAAAGSAVLSQAASYQACLLAMGLIGLGSSAIYMSAVYTFARTGKPERLALLFSLLLGLGSAGNLLASRPFASTVASLGWEPTFLAVAAATATVAGIAFLAVPRIGQAAAAPGTSGAGYLPALRQILGMRQLWPVLPIIVLSHAVMLAERGLWVGPYLAQVHGLDAVATGTAVLLVAIAMSAGALAYGPLDVWLGTRKWIVFWGTIAAGLLFLVLGLLPHLSLTPAVALLVALGAAGMTYGVLLAHVRAFLPDHLLGRGITFFNFFFFWGAGLLQPVSGAIVAELAARGTPAPLVFGTLHSLFGLLLILSAFVYLRAEDRPP